MPETVEPAVAVSFPLLGLSAAIAFGLTHAITLTLIVIVVPKRFARFMYGATVAGGS
jgi:hypothetical protein